MIILCFHHSLHYCHLCQLVHFLLMGIVHWKMGGLLPLQLILLLIKHQKLWAEHLAQNGFTRETGIVKWRYETMGQEGLV
ncbi:ORF1155 [White spot syndrome virus]|uniref:Wsv132 n=3 Tax=White spot syndrome virus TaxID=342409 RepID=Q8VB59_WSSVS|nr:wsv132 [Shrimp white spot syndrome virus]AFX59508.1 wsv132 [White spot syndrome virus]AAL33136.1 wsv132 [Shrimp white spot syndrome virus]AAL89055.1 WSSV187 [Shrimp white spot syndrome virus]ATU83855.1 ORF1155 [White spot syndrome virus]AWQ60317.1 wsv132 [Shrimp white spot syndrome virus]